ELAHKVYGKHTDASTAFGKNCRILEENGILEYEMKTGEAETALAVTYSGHDAGMKFEIHIDGQLYVKEEVPPAKEEFYTKYYQLPEALIENKKKIKIAFKTPMRGMRCRIYGVLYTCKAKKVNNLCKENI
ncbi:MAG TPA: DUF6805 domain-containing protein, partial [Lachnospiraceae bacterium]